MNTANDAVNIINAPGKDIFKALNKNLKVAEAITKFKELKDMGVLSDEEFEERKKSLLLSVNDKKIPEHRCAGLLRHTRRSA